jgi:Ca2+-binding RTX toxin-like protein
VLGSAFSDKITGTGAANNLDGGPGDDEITGGGGSDALNGGPGNDGCDLDPGDKVTACGVGRVPETPLDTQPTAGFVLLDPRGPDPGLYVIGQPNGGGDDLLVTAGGSGFTVNSPSGTPIVQLPDPINLCGRLSNGATCSAPSSALSFITFWGGDGNDNLKLAGAYPAALTAVLNGGPGSDIVEGTPGDDILFSGLSGYDTLRGGEGSDALLALGTGGDSLSGGGGNDQLVTDDPCQGHDYNGGSGFDIAGFARYTLALAGKTGVKATLGGTATDPGRAGCAATQIRGDVEILEGSSGADQLYGDNRNNPLITGRGGNDVIHGMGGADTLTGDGGQDSIYGDSGFDTLESQDGVSDQAVHCGAGGGEAFRDTNDPVRGCKKLKKGKRKRK